MFFFAFAPLFVAKTMCVAYINCMTNPLYPQEAFSQPNFSNDNLFSNQFGQQKNEQNNLLTSLLGNKQNSPLLPILVKLLTGKELPGQSLNESLSALSLFGKKQQPLSKEKEITFPD